MLFRIGQLGSGLTTFLHLQRGLGGRFFVKGGIAEFLVQCLNQFLKLCRQGFDFVDLFAKRSQRGALFGIRLALVRF